MTTMNPDFSYEDLLPLGHDETKYRLVTTEGITTTEAAGRKFITVSQEALRKLTEEAVHDIQHYLRASHLQQ